MITVAESIQAPVAWMKTATGKSFLPKETLGIGGWGFIPSFFY